MAKQDMSQLGFGKESDKETPGEKVTERIDNGRWYLLKIEDRCSRGRESIGRCWFFGDFF